MHRLRISRRTLVVLLLVAGLAFLLFHPLLLGAAHHDYAHCPVCYLLNQGFTLAQAVWVFFVLQAFTRASCPSPSPSWRTRPAPRGRAPPHIRDISPY